MVNAVLAAEDKHFFQHSGFDPVGIVRALWIDLRSTAREPGRVDADAAAGADVCGWVRSAAGGAKSPRR